ncbi:hypothetical protein EJ08DRAFT_705791 [Tothia fuscella]|uniref:Uncharacterized protein n=1 Tax=Tothia fuscella TaxID=1048955 RepID=A0A9P4TSY6_9PEZI|nr:hypothetical protein EJ08DRAFT_705791 [Tothia fuscella]
MASSPPRKKLKTSHTAPLGKDSKSKQAIDDNQAKTLSHPQNNSKDISSKENSTEHNANKNIAGNNNTNIRLTHKNNENPTSHLRPFKFLELPGETRNAIYSYLLVVPKGRSIYPREAPSKYITSLPRDTKVDTVIFYTNHQVYDEARSLMLAQNTINLDFLYSAVLKKYQSALLTATKFSFSLIPCRDSFDFRIIDKFLSQHSNIMKLNITYIFLASEWNWRSNRFRVSTDLSNLIKSLSQLRVIESVSIGYDSTAPLFTERYILSFQDKAVEAAVKMVQDLRDVMNVDAKPATSNEDVNTA